MARWEHFWLTMSFLGFFVVHVGQVVLAGWNNFRSMVTGLEIKRADEPSLDLERGEGAMSEPEVVNKATGGPVEPGESAPGAGTKDEAVEGGSGERSCGSRRS